MIGCTILWQVSRRLIGPRRENIFCVPFATVLFEAGVTDETGFHQHDVRGLKDTLQVRRISLDEW